MTDEGKLKRLTWLQNILKPSRKTRIVDVGANPIGETPYNHLLVNNYCEVWGFEPQLKEFEVLSENARENEFYLPFAIGDGELWPLHICKGSGFSSLFKPNRKFIDFMGRWPALMRVIDMVQVETRRLDDIEKIPEFDLLKIDVQGAEADVFRYGANKISGALAVISEVAAVELYENQPLLDDQMRELRRIGFSLHKFLFMKSYMCRSSFDSKLRPKFNKNQLVDADAVFIRNLLELRGHSDEELKHLAVLADAVFESFDIAVFAMQILMERSRVSEADIDEYIKTLPNTVRR